MTELKPILYAEDNLNDQELTLHALKEANIHNPIDVVRDGKEALDYLYCRGKFAGRQNINPILILLDIKMPRLSGLEALAIIKKDEKLKHIPAVILTSSLLEADQLQSYESGANSYVVKPINFEDFHESVKKLGIYWALINKPI